LSPLEWLELIGGIALWLVIAVGSDPEQQSPRWMQLASAWFVGAVLFGGIAVWLVFFVIQNVPAPTL